MFVGPNCQRGCPSFGEGLGPPYLRDNLVYLRLLGAPLRIQQHQSVTRSVSTAASVSGMDSGMDKEWEGGGKSGWRGSGGGE